MIFKLYHLCYSESMDFDYTVPTPKSFDDAVSAVEQGIAASGMRVLHVHDVQQNLGEKGFVREPFKIIEFCNAKYAHDFLRADIKIGLCMPCKINVYAVDGQTIISGMRPLVLSQFFPDADLGNNPEEIDAKLRGIVDGAK